MKSIKDLFKYNGQCILLMFGIFLSVNNVLADLSPSITATPGDIIYKIEPGDNLWKIAKKIYNDPFKWPLLYRGDKRSMLNPDAMEPGDFLIAPDEKREGRLKDANHFASLYKEKEGIETPDLPYPGAPDFFAPHKNLFVQKLKDGRYYVLFSDGHTLMVYDLNYRPLCELDLKETPTDSFMPVGMAVVLDPKGDYLVLMDKKEHSRTIGLPLPFDFQPLPTPTPRFVSPHDPWLVMTLNSVPISPSDLKRSKSHENPIPSDLTAPIEIEMTPLQNPPVNFEVETERGGTYLTRGLLPGTKVQTDLVTTKYKAYLTWDSVPGAIGYNLYISTDWEKFKKQYKKLIERNNATIDLIKGHVYMLNLTYVNKKGESDKAILMMSPMEYYLNPWTNPKSKKWGFN